MVGLEALEAAVGADEDVVAGAVVALHVAQHGVGVGVLWLVAEADLGDQDDLIAAITQRVGQQALRVERARSATTASPTTTSR